MAEEQTTETHDFLMEIIKREIEALKERALKNLRK
jgi:hypothetical protein